MTVYERLGIIALLVASAAIGAVVTYNGRPAMPVVAVTETRPMQPTRTKGYFLAHRDEMRVKIAVCNNNPGVAGSDPECENAAEAYLD